MNTESQELHPSDQLFEDEANRHSSWPGSIVQVVVVLAVLWILLLSYFVAAMPHKS